MPKIVPIVEGEGEKKAVPALCYKILRELERYDISVAAPLAVKGVSNLTKAGGLEAFLKAANREPDCAAILVLIDADEACALTFAKGLSRRVLDANLPVPVTIVIAVCEYEAWFLASLKTMCGRDIGGRFTLPADLDYKGDVESRRGVKEWLGKALPNGIVYAPAVDQAPMSRLIDPVEARVNSRSFRRLCHAIEQIVNAIDNNKIVVTPEVD